MKISHITQLCGCAVTLVTELDTSRIAVMKRVHRFDYGHVTNDYAKFLELLESLSKLDQTTIFRAFSKKEDKFARAQRVFKQQRASIFKLKQKISVAFCKSSTLNDIPRIAETDNVVVLHSILFYPHYPRYENDRHRDSRVCAYLVILNIETGNFYLSEATKCLSGATLSKCPDIVKRRSRKKNIWCVNEKVVEQFIHQIEHDNPINKTHFEKVAQFL